MHRVPYLLFLNYPTKFYTNEYLKQIFSSPTREMAHTIAQHYETSYPKVSHMLQEELEFTLTYLAYPKHHRRKIRTANLIEGVINKDLKQRSGVVGIFSNQKSCICYASLRLMEIDEEWQTGRRYMKISKEDQFPHEDDPLLCKIKEMKSRVNAQEELVAI